jgi:hypothetical protein
MISKEKSTQQNALLVFVDIIDSSANSKFLGLDKFADNVLKFQKLFTILGNTYFYNKFEFKEAINYWCSVNSRGDEGLVFIIDKTANSDDLIFNAIRFLFELKARLNSIFSSKTENDPPPRTMKIAAGIHYGPVIPITTLAESRKKISEIIGYNINYAKRVESESRNGVYSNIFLSLEAANQIRCKTIFLKKQTGNLKGIENGELLFEVQSALFENPVKLEQNPVFAKETSFTNYFQEQNQLLESFVSDALLNDVLLIREPWMISYIASYLFQKNEDIGLSSQKSKNIEIFDKYIWNCQFDNDPTINYIRAIDCEQNSKITRAISYYKNIIDTHSYFKIAQTNLLKACHKVLKNGKAVTSEKIFIRDTAEELLKKHSELFEKKEKDALVEIINEYKEF